MTFQNIAMSFFRSNDTKKNPSIISWLLSKRKRTLPIDRFLGALGIPWVGKRTAKLLAALFHKTEDILDFHLTLEELEAVKDIGPGTAGTIAQYFETHKHLLERLLARVTVVFPEIVETSWALSGKTFCVTGTFDISRDEIHTIIEENGGEVRTAVSGNLDYSASQENLRAVNEKKLSHSVWKYWAGKSFRKWYNYSFVSARFGNIAW
jgi:DNA ligase (NAD+)